MTIRFGLLMGIGLLSLGFAFAQPRPLPAPTPAALSGLNALEAMALANAWGRVRAPVQSFVTPQVVQFKFKDARTVSIPLPKDRMVVAIAPYITRTHPCKTHFMSGCQGELVNIPVGVTVRSTDGTLVFEGSVRTLENGFLELWLPRDLDLTVRLEAQDKTVNGAIATFASSDTCVTTLRLQ
jgi:hypothetical protein